METLTVGYAHDIYGQIILDDNGELQFTGERAGILKKLFADLQKHPVSPMTNIELYHSLPTRLRNYFWASFNSQVKFNPYHDNLGRFAATPASLAASLHREHPEVTFNFDGLTTKDAQDIAMELNTNLHRYPGVKKNLDYVGTSTRAPKIYKAQVQRKTGMPMEVYLEDTTGAMTMGNGKEGAQWRQCVIFNERFYNSPKRQQYEYESVATEWHQPLKDGVSFATYDTKHEFGHVLMNQIHAEGGGKAFLPYTDGEKGYIQPTFMQWVNDHVLEAMGTSGYAYNGGFQEGWAEGYAQEGLAKNPMPFSQSVHKALSVFYTPEGYVRIENNPLDINGATEERAKAEKMFRETDALLEGPQL